MSRQSQGLIILTLLFLAGCSGSNRPIPPLPDLNLPGVTQIPGITTLHAPPQRGSIDSVATYLPAGQTTAHVLFTLDGNLYSVGLDGSDLHALQITCRDDVAISPDGRWAVCVHEDVYLAVISLTAAPPHNVQLLTLPTGPFTGVLNWGSPTWLPDDHHVAVVTHLDDGCSVAIYTLSGAYDHAQMAGLLTFPMFVTPAGAVGGPGCAVATLSGSPNGAWLAFIGEADSQFTLYALPVADSVAALLRSAVPLALQVNTSQLIALGDPYLTAPSWSGPATDWRLTFTSGDSQHLIQVDLTTRQSSTLLGVQDGQVTASAWTPDGRHLVFANGQPSCLECQPSFTPSHLYVYTPQA